LSDKDAVEFVKQILDDLSALYVPEQNAIVKADTTESKAYLEAHKPFLINAVRKLGKPINGSYSLVLTHTPSRNDLVMGGL
jgi:hypothetical protein